MRHNPPTHIKAFRAVGLLLLASLFLVGLPAYGQAIKVTSAVPDSGDQGVVGLVVTIGGENFASGAKVAFYVTGTTNPGGIAVKGVKFKDSRTLEATIDVAPDAQTDLKFDVQVKCGGRTGKGTELFKVNVKVTGNDTIPPGSVLDLSAAPYDFNLTRFTWTAPADDGYDTASGPAASHVFSIRKGYAPESPDCGPFTEAVWGGTFEAYDPWRDPCYAGRSSICPLAPSTEYWAIVRYCDDANPTGNCSPLAEDLTHQLRFVTPPPTHTNWSVSIADACPPPGQGTCSMSDAIRFDLDLAGSPAILYDESDVRTLASWNGSAWLTEPVGPGISGGSYEFAFDPSGFATVARSGPTGAKWDLRFFRRTGATSATWESETIAPGTSTVYGYGVSALGFNPLDGSPAIVYFYRSKQSKYSMRLAERHGSTWSDQDVATEIPSGLFVQGRQLAFDPAGNPAFVFFREVDGAPGLVFSVRQSGVSKLESAAGIGTPGGPWTRGRYPVVAFDPVRGDFSAACHLDGPSGNQITFCERNAGTWTCEPMDLARDGTSFTGLSLAVRSDGTVFLAYTLSGVRVAAIRSPGGAWEREYVDWNGGGSQIQLRIGTDGRPIVVYSADHDATGAGLVQTIYCAQRQ